MAEPRFHYLNYILAMHEHLARVEQYSGQMEVPEGVRKSFLVPLYKDIEARTDAAIREYVENLGKSDTLYLTHKDSNQRNITYKITEVEGVFTLEEASDIPASYQITVPDPEPVAS